MGSDRFGKSREVVTPFEDGHYATLGVAVGDGQEFPGQPYKVFRLDLEPGQRIGGVGVEARRDDDQLRREAVERRQDAIAPGGAELRPTGAGRQGGMGRPGVAGGPLSAATIPPPRDPGR